MPSSPAATSRGASARSSLRSIRMAAGRRMSPATVTRSTSSGSGARCRTRALVATGASPHIVTAISPLAVPDPAPDRPAPDRPAPDRPAPADRTPVRSPPRAGTASAPGRWPRPVFPSTSPLSCNGLIQFNTYTASGHLTRRQPGQTGPVTLIVVSGAPATGKSTIAAALSTELRWPLLPLDPLKETLADVLGLGEGLGDEHWSDSLGDASAALIFRLTAQFSDAIAEGWWRGQRRELALAA